MSDIVLDRPRGWSEPPPNPDLTLGDYQTEDDAVEAIHAALYQTRMFWIYRQVQGAYIYQPPHQERKSPRIDLVLVPKPDALYAGWLMGRVGIECKRSGVKIGRPISQALDYHRSLWQVPAEPHQWFALSWVFIWPMALQHGPLGSVLSQQRIGSLLPDSRGGLAFAGGQHVLAQSGPTPDEWKFSAYQESMGRKAGSR